MAGQAKTEEAMNAEDMTDVLFNALKLPSREWAVEFDDYNPQLLVVTNLETDEEFLLSVSKADS